MELRIPEPCPEPWEAMEPRPDGRHCRRCGAAIAPQYPPHVYPMDGAVAF